MKRAILILAAGLLALGVAACNETNKPEITRIFATPSCGVAPLQVEVYGIASGGNETGDATGGNNNLDFKWDFGDGGTSNTSIAFHTYGTPGDYDIVLRVEDTDGNSATRTLPVTVVADSLEVEAMASATDVAAGTTVDFDYRAGTCGVDRNSLSDRASYLEQRWFMHDPAVADGGIYTGAEPQHTFTAAGVYPVEVRVTYVGWAVTRADTITITVN